MNVMTFLPTFEEAPRMLERLRAAGFNPYPVSGLDEALEAVRQTEFHALVIVGVPESDDFIQQVRRHGREYLYTIALRPRGMEQSALDGLADEVLWLPCEPDELIARLTVMERYQDVLQGLRSVSSMEPVRDARTGAFTASSIRELLEAEMQRSRRNGQAFTVILGRLQAESEAVLPPDGYEKAMAFCVMKVWSSVRAYDLIGHWGEDCLLIVLPETTIGAVVVLNRIRRRVESVPFYLDEEHPIRLRLAMVATQSQPEKTRSVDALLQDLEEDLQRLSVER